MRGYHAPALRGLHPGLRLPADALAARAAELDVRRAERLAVGRDLQAQDLARQAGGRPGRAKGADLVDAVEVLGRTVAHGLRAVPEQLVQRRDVVLDERPFVAIEDAAQLGQHLESIDDHSSTA